MVPRLAAEGSSFHGAFLYYFHDKNARTSQRVAWTGTLNMVTENIGKAWKVMAFTAKHQERLKEVSNQRRSGAKLKNPVLAFSLSWHPEQKPDREAMLEAARTSLEKLGLGDHETMIACHTDEPQPHIHLVVNKVHPRTGLVANLKHTKRKLQDWARDYQKMEGTKYCPMREENHRKREAGGSTRYGNPAIVEAWKNSRDADSFVKELEVRGYDLAQGRKRLVVVDPYGKSSNPARELKAALGDEFKEQDFRDRLSGISPAALPTPEAIMEKRAAEEKRKKEQRRAFEQKVSSLFGTQAENHREQREAVLERHGRLEMLKRDELHAFYQTAEQQRQIARLQKELHRPGLVRKIGFVLFRTDRKLKQMLAEAEVQHDASRRRIEEELGKLAIQREDEMKRLAERQLRETEELMRRVELWRPEERRQRSSHEQQTMEVSLKRDGPSLSR